MRYFDGTANRGEFMYTEECSVMEMADSGWYLSRQFIPTILPVVSLIMVMLTSSCSTLSVFEPLVFNSYESRVQSVIEQGSMIKNYLRSLDYALQEGNAKTIVLMAPEALRPFPPCQEQVGYRTDLRGVEIVRWKSNSEFDRVNPWHNLANHWKNGAKVSQSLLKMIHLNKIDEHTCEPEIRISVEGIDSDGKHRQDVSYARLSVDFSGPTFVVRDIINYTAYSLIRTGDTLFKDESVDRGLVFHPPKVPFRDDLKFSIFTAMGGGVAVADMDADGWEDVYLIGSQPNTSRLFKNVSGEFFEDITARSGLANSQNFAMAAAVGDVDGDTDLDIVVTHGFAPPTLFRNQGDAVFIGEPFQPIDGQKDEGATTPTFADVDNDGDLDLYISYYGPVTDQVPDTIFIGLNGLQDRLYINDGTGHFSEEARSRGLSESRWTFQGAFADIDEDGDVDLYQINDFGRNTLYLNDGTGNFKDCTLDWLGTEAFGFGMSGSWGDLNADGKLDMYISGIASGIQWFAEQTDVMRFYLLNAKRSRYLPPAQVKRITEDLEPYMISASDLLDSLPAIRQRYFKGNVLLRRNGDQFDNISQQSETEYAQWSWGSGFVDFQNDGFVDLYATNGFITGKKKDDL